MFKFLSLTACLALAGLVAAQTGATRKNDERQPGLFDSKAFIKKYDKNNDGTLARDEMPEKMRKWYDRIDTDKDGKLTDAELRQHARRMWRSAPVEVVSIWVVEAVDPLTVSEVQQAYESLRKLDSDNDGKITEKEIKAGYKEMVKKRIDAVVERYDTDDDGKVSKEEAEAGPLTRSFKQLDANGDGYIDRAEMEKAAMPGRDAGAKDRTKDGNRDKPGDR